MALSQEIQPQLKFKASLRSGRSGGLLEVLSMERALGVSSPFAHTFIAFLSAQELLCLFRLD
jgi:hypothetical protein